MVAETKFVQLNEGWSPEPNACDGLELAVEGDTLFARFWTWDEERVLQLRFEECDAYQVHTWRAESVAYDEGRDRFSFKEALELSCSLFEVKGDAQFEKLGISWIELSGHPAAKRHFIMMLHDHTFECRANDWSVQEATKNTNLNFERPVVQFANG